MALAAIPPAGNAAEARALSTGIAAPASGEIYYPQFSGAGSTLWFLAEPGAAPGGPGLHKIDLATLAPQLVLPGRILSFAVAGSGGAVAVELAEDHPELGDSNRVPDVYHLDLASGRLSLASRRMAAPGAGARGARNPQIGHAGNLVLFESNSSDLATQDTNADSDIFLYNSADDSVSLISSGPTNPAATASHGGYDPFFALEDQAVLYTTRAPVVSPDESNTPDLHLRLLNPARTVTRVNVGAGGVKISSCCEAPTISPNGRFATFRSGFPARKLHVKDLTGGDLVEIPAPHHTVTNIPPSEVSDDGARLTLFRPNSTPGGSGLLFQVFDRPAGRDIVVAPSGVGPTPAFTPRWMRLSSNGRHLFFTARADQVCCGSPFPLPADLFHRDLDSPDIPLDQFVEARRVSRPWPGLPNTGGVGQVALAETPNAEAPFQIAWESSTSAADGSAVSDIFWTPFPSDSAPRSLRALLNESIQSTTAPGHSLLGPIPMDGRSASVAFESSAPLAAGLPSNFRQIYLRPAGTGAARLISAGADNTPADAPSYAPSVSADGNAVAFFSLASNLAAGDVNTNTADLFLYERATGKIELVNTGLPGFPAPAQGHRPTSPALSADASKIAFIAQPSSSANPVLFLRDRVAGATRVASQGVAQGSSGVVSGRPAHISRDGRWLLYHSTSTTAAPQNFRGTRLWNTETAELVGVPDADGSLQGLDPANIPFDHAGSQALLLNTTASRKAYLFDITTRLLKPLATNCLASGLSGDGRVAFAISNADPANPILEFVLVGDGSRAAIPLGFASQESAPRVASASLSDNGDWLAFSAGMNHTPSGDTNNALDIFLAHRPTGSLRRLDFLEGLSPSHPVLAPDGSFLLFHAMADSGGDRNGSIDIYRLDLDSAPADSDGDGLPDPWETTYFDNLGAGPDEDPDGDGMTNLQEYRAGTNPRDGASILALQALRSVTTGAVHLVWAAAPGVRYQVEWRHALDGSAWEPLGPAATHEAGAATAVDTSASAPSRFYRLRVVP